jgi:hypothetical protein
MSQNAAPERELYELAKNDTEAIQFSTNISTKIPTQKLHLKGHYHACWNCGI